MNGSERLVHEGVKTQAERGSREGFWHTPPLDVEGTNGRLMIAFLATEGNNAEGIAEGVYAVASVRPQDYETHEDLREFVRRHVEITLPGLSGGETPFELTPASQTTPGGSVILRIGIPESTA